jgi:hypothetical protein
MTSAGSDRVVAVIPTVRPDRIEPSEPPGIEPVPAEPTLPGIPEVEPPSPDRDQPGRCPEEYPGSPNRERAISQRS